MGKASLKKSKKSFIRHLQKVSLHHFTDLFLPAFGKQFSDI